MHVSEQQELTAGLDDAVIYSHGKKLLGGFYRGAGIGPRPTAVLLHGVPGVEKNLDVAYMVRDRGWNCLYLHYRGSWGSDGRYSFGGAFDDVQAAISWVIEQPSVDPQRLALVGNSFGGYLALATAASDPRIDVVVSIAPLVDPRTVQLSDELFVEFARMLSGVSGDDLRRQWNALAPIQSVATDLEGKQILLITADADEIFPAEHYETLTTTLSEIQWVRVPGADHVFSAFRRQLVELTVEGLEKAIRR